MTIIDGDVYFDRGKLVAARDEAPKKGGRP
jgi:hypothetical protein